MCAISNNVDLQQLALDGRFCQIFGTFLAAARHARRRPRLKYCCQNDLAVVARDDRLLLGIEHLGLDAMVDAPVEGLEL